MARCSYCGHYVDGDQLFWIVSLRNGVPTRRRIGPICLHFVCRRKYERIGVRFVRCFRAPAAGA